MAAAGSSEDLIGVGSAIRAVQAEMEYAARSDAKVLLSGESGVGKEVVARLIHQRSRRGRTPLVTINCAAIPDTLLESALFGHVRGSFTGAYQDRQGLLEMANGGTIFLDEVGEMSLRMQALLLRVVENGELQRIGADRVQTRVDVRIIAATNRRLIDRIAANEFREDLYYRLNVIHLTIPPLRERREDIPAFLEYFMRLYASRHGIALPAIDEDAYEQLIGYDWPGNVRELKNAVERLIIRSESGRITRADLPVDTRRPASGPVTAAWSRADELFERMVTQRESFWSAVYTAFMSRDLTREDLRAILRKGLEQAGGNYKIVLQLFNMPAGDYKRFLNFLRKHDCHVPFQPFRTARPVRDERPITAEPAV